ncbi:transposase [Puia sp.]|uniref:transposase n=1 Tax=Puia sp. TaxID=2045100 RepID=UPI002F41DF75
MKKQISTEAQIVSILKQYDGGPDPTELCREFGISKATLYNWHKKSAGMDAAHLKEWGSLAAWCDYSIPGEKVVEVLKSIVNDRGRPEQIEWQDHYNNYRPHSALKGKTPGMARECLPAGSSFPKTIEQEQMHATQHRKNTRSLSRKNETKV